jgi:hypothetical protein
VEYEKVSIFRNHGAERNENNDILKQEIPGITTVQHKAAAQSHLVSVPVGPMAKLLFVPTPYLFRIGASSR